MYVRVSYVLIHLIIKITVDATSTGISILQTKKLSPT